MPQVSLEFPMLVSTVKIDDKKHYLVRPFFQDYPNARAQRYEPAIAKLKKEIREYFKHYIPSRANINNLLWFTFNPEPQLHNFHFTFNLGNQYVDATFTVIEFDVENQKVISLPGFQNYMAILKPNEKHKYNVKNGSRLVIEKLLREQKKRNNNKTVNLTPFVAVKGDFISHFSYNINVKKGQFKFEGQVMPWFFSSMASNMEFNGATEIVKVGKDLNELYPSGLKSAFYQEALVNRISKIIYKEENTPIVIIGEDGVGKHSLLEEVIYRYVGQNAHREAYHLQKIWRIDPNRIIAGMSIVGQWQKRFESILKYVKTRRNKIHGVRLDETDKIMIDNPVALLRIGKSAQNDMTLSDVLKPYLEKRKIGIILIATPEQWKIVQDKDRRFADLFQIVRVNEANRKTAAQMVLQQRKLLELENSCIISTHAIYQLFNIQRNYLKRKALPGSVMKLLRQLATKYKYQNIDVQEVKKEFEAFSGLSQEIFDEDYIFKKSEVKDKISTQLIGQPDAVDALAKVVHNIKAKLTNPDKPLASFLFIGPTGVGKTQAAKVINEYLMGNNEQLLRFDMNEYIDPYSSQRLIGDFYNPEGILTGRVRYRPFGVVLFDEIEKAHPNIHDLLLQVLDDGRLTDSLGRTVDFSNIIIIMTSNVGARDVGSSISLGNSDENEAAIYKKAVENRFRPEFVNRIDEIIIFNSLKLEHIQNIAKLQINDLLTRDGFVRRTTILNISGEALEWVATRGFDSKMGGRALKRQIEKDLTSLSADQLIGSYSKSPIIFDIEYENGRLRPKITTLDFVEQIEEEWLPELPDEKKGGQFYNQLLQRLITIEDRIKDEQDDQMIMAYSDFSGDDDDNWEYWWFKDQLTIHKENIQNLLAGFRSQHFRGGPAIPFRLKGSTWKRLFPSRFNERDAIKDQLFQKEGLKEIIEFYRLAPTQFDSIHTEFIDNYLNVSFLAYFAEGFIDNHIETITLKMQSCITNKGDDEILALLKIYKTFFEHFNIQCEINEPLQQITATGYNLYGICKSEAGMHMFYLPHENPLPIKVTLRLEGEQSKTHSFSKVIRVYDNKNTMTDIRTGFTTDFKITPSEFKLLIYAGGMIPQKV